MIFTCRHESMRVLNYALFTHAYQTLCVYQTLTAHAHATVLHIPDPRSPILNLVSPSSILDSRFSILDILDSRSSIDSRFSILDPRSSILDPRFSILDPRFSLLDSRFSNFDSRFSILDARSSILDSRFSILDSRCSILDSRFSILDSPLRVQGLKLFNPEFFQSGLKRRKYCFFSIIILKKKSIFY